MKKKLQKIKNLKNKNTVKKTKFVAFLAYYRVTKGEFNFFEKIIAIVATCKISRTF